MNPRRCLSALIPLALLSGAACTRPAARARSSSGHRSVRGELRKPGAQPPARHRGLAFDPVDPLVDLPRGRRRGLRALPALRAYI